MNREQVIEIYRQVLERKRKRFPNYFFIGEEGKKYMGYITCYLLEQRLSIPIQEIPLQVTAGILWSHRLKPPAMLYGWNYYEVIDNAYPGKFKAWQFQQVPDKYWHGDEGKKRAIEAVKYVIEEELKIPLNEIPIQVNIHFFNQHSLGGVFSLFGQSPFQVVEAVYPGVFKPWQFAHVPMNCWKNKEYIQEAMDDFLFKQLHFSSYKEAFFRLKGTHFTDFQLTGLFQMAFESRMNNVKKWIKKQLTDMDKQSLYIDLD
ncbi:hypothetical protein IAE23_27145 [Bacillus sp. S35]|uniref:hypothetical protein n=1 Tax=Priestia aryabhattai TaxID=412384 RepID=UPI00190938A4|nr:hypothetical protein [Priestia aryabhattai]MBK0010147.1 hypothetical protein [Bacillus sp. S35]MCM3644689.1 hypothetical protein [Priestia aryabhattai]